MKLKTDPRVIAVFEAYPEKVKDKMQALRKLVIEVAEEMEIPTLEETLKWGEPSYLVKNGSTLRMDWKEKSPEQYALYFKCTSRLVETFRLVFKDALQYEGKRAILFKLNDPIPKAEIKKCIKATLQYHLIKHDITLGL